MKNWIEVFRALVMALIVIIVFKGFHSGDGGKLTAALIMAFFIFIFFFMGILRFSVKHDYEALNDIRHRNFTRTDQQVRDLKCEYHGVIFKNGVKSPEKEKELEVNYRFVSVLMYVIVIGGMGLLIYAYNR